jgi:hypothetical protein
VRYTTDLSDEVWFYLRGEEYSAQIDYFAQSIKARRLDGENTFAGALGRRPGGRSDARRRSAHDVMPAGTLRRRPDPASGRESSGEAMSSATASDPVAPMDRVLFGDNQFFGVNHMSEEKARAQSMRFQDLDAIIAVLDAAYEEGIRTFMCTSHDRVAEICDHFRGNPDKYPDYRFYPCMPYAHKYANAVTEHGMIEALRMFLPQEGAVAAMLKGGVALASKDIESIMQLLIDAEMKMFHGLSTPVVFMQNVITDLLLGLRMHDASASSTTMSRTRYGAEPGYITMNVPRLLDALDALGIDNPIVCANINKIGFRMCGGVPPTKAPSRADAFARSRCRSSPRARSAARSHRVRLRSAADRVDRLRRIRPGEHPADEVADRRSQPSSPRLTCAGRRLSEGSAPVCPRRSPRRARPAGRRRWRR